MRRRHAVGARAIHREERLRARGYRPRKILPGDKVDEVTGQITFAVPKAVVEAPKEEPKKKAPAKKKTAAKKKAAPKKESKK